MSGEVLVDLIMIGGTTNENVTVKVNFNIRLSAKS